MNTYEFCYVTEERDFDNTAADLPNRFLDSIFVDAPNRIAAWEMFAELAKNFEDDVVSADCYLVENED